MRMRRLQHTAMLGMLLFGAVTACSGAPTSPAAASKTSAASAAAPAPSSGSMPGPPAQAALAAYVAAWADAADVEDGGNYKDPRLERHIAGNLLETIAEDDYVEEAHGVASRGMPILHPHVSAVNLSSHPPTVTITDCIDFRHFIQYYAATGRQYGVVQTGLSANTSTVTLINGSWMVTSAATGADGSCSL